MSTYAPPVSARLRDPHRLAGVAHSGLLEGVPDAVFDRLTRLATRLLGTPLSLVSLLTDTRHHVVSEVGLGAPWRECRELPMSYSFCQHVIGSGAAFMVEDARTDPRVAESPAFADLGVCAYAGVPLALTDGRTLGSFCVLDTVPRAWSALDLEGLRDLAAVAAAELETRVRAGEAADARRALEVTTTALRESETGLHAAQAEVIARLAQTAEMRDDETGLHTRRVGELSARLAAALGLSDAEVALIRQAAPLHDVGKIGVPDAVLLKPGHLTPDELAIMRAHTTLGARLLAGSGAPLTQLAEAIAHAHHERWDGTGYPRALAGEAIPLAARIVAVADVVDALAHDRPYRAAWPFERVVAHVRAGSGTHFDPTVAAAFLRAPEVEGVASQPAAPA